MICSVAMSENVTKTDIKSVTNAENKSNDFAVQFQNRFTNSDTEKWLFPTKTEGERSGKKAGKIDGKMDGKSSRERAWAA